ncbi:MAG: phospho-sugar mutase, partial [Lachnospiraceae bacterium]|nr:phospho-sugar mutase [Lachnospiraceae bacterium]
IMITASHNPREYNGYKVCWEDGAQITPPHDKNIMAEVAKVTDFSMVKTMPEEDAKDAGLFVVLGTDIDDRYVAKVKEQCIHPEVIRQAAPAFKIVYTPLNGAGNLPVRRILRELGFENVYVVEEQEPPDGNFPTLASRNTEGTAGWLLALALAKEKDADLVLATDPDADRLGVWVKKDKTGEYVPFTGNMSGVLIAEYLLREKTRMGTLPEHPAVIETIVTTDMLKAAVKFWHVDLIEVLTGFKYIGEQIRIFEETGSRQFVFGMEESYGALAGTYARDKDAQVAVMLLGEVACWYHMQGKTLCDAMDELYEKYGYYKEGLTSVTKKGLDGTRKIRQIMEHLRQNPPAAIGGMDVLAIRDYSVDTRIERKDSTIAVTGEKGSSMENADPAQKNEGNGSSVFAGGRIMPTGLPKSNVLYYELENNAWCCVRPSGTEPKIKFYYGVKGSSPDDAEQKLEILKEACGRLCAD